MTKQELAGLIQAKREELDGLDLQEQDEQVGLAVLDVVVNDILDILDVFGDIAPGHLVRNEVLLYLDNARDGNE